MNLRTFFGELAPRHICDLARLFRNHRWERNDDGEILISHARIGGVFECDGSDGQGAIRTPNLCTTEGCNYLLSVGLAGGSNQPTFYIAPFSGNVAVTDALTAANFASTQTELSTQYSEATRVAYVESVPANKSTNNDASPATVTMATTNVTIWGLGLLSNSTKLATTGVCLAAAKYATARVFPAIGDKLGIRYTLTLTNV